MDPSYRRRTSTLRTPVNRAGRLSWLCASLLATLDVPAEPSAALPWFSEFGVQQTRGFRALKLRLGYLTAEEDLAAVRAVRTRMPDAVKLMVDYNQALGVEEAIRRARALDSEGVYWIEEPIRHDDYKGCAEIAAAAATPVQIGENFSQVFDMQKALDAGACDCVMPDLERIGGVTGWRLASALAASASIPMSSHLYPEVSVHLLSATPTAHWLEYVDWMNPLLAEPLAIVDGMAVPSDEPGLGLTWDEQAVHRAKRKFEN